MNKYYNEINNFIEEHREEMLKKWETFVNLEGHYNEKENVEKAQEWLRKEFEEEGFECYIKEVASDKAGVLVGMLGKERGTAPIIFSGHIDTVHRTGSFGEKPFKIEDGKAFGPGVLDMKGGILISLYAIKALNSIGYNEHPIKIMYAGEEESDHIGNNADLFYENESKGAICAFNMETGHITNSLCVGRKAQYTFFATIKGLGGHAGNEFTKGKNAIHEAVYKINEMMKLTDLNKGTTVTTSVIHAGENTSSIPDLCKVVFDVRFTNAKEGEYIAEYVDKVMNTAYIEGTVTEYYKNLAKLKAFDGEPQVMKLFNFVNEVAKENEFPEFGQIKLGGASDAGNIAASGIPVICSCGVIGEFNHNIREYAVVESLFDRSKIFALAVLEINKMIENK